MPLKLRIKTILAGTLFLGIMLAQAAWADADANPNESVQKFRKDCMDSLGNEPFCACMANVLTMHVPKEHLSHNEDGEIQFHEDMSEDAHNNATKGAAECQEKFRPEAAESTG